MRLSYDKLWALLVEKRVSRKELREAAGISTGTMTKINQGQGVSTAVLLKICEHLNCNIGDICDVVPDAKDKFKL